MKKLSINTTFFESDEVQAIEGQFGLKGVIVYMRLLCAIKDNGYFLELTEIKKLALCNKVPGLQINELEQILHFMVSTIGVFSAETFESIIDEETEETCTVLTSESIQSDYAKSHKRSKNKPTQYWLLDTPEEPVEDVKKPEPIHVPDTVCGQLMGFESNDEPPKPIEPEIEYYHQTLTSTTGPVRIPLKNIEAWKSAYPNVDIDREIKQMEAWLVSNPKKQKTARGMMTFANSWLAKSQDRPSGGRSVGQPYQAPARPITAKGGQSFEGIDYVKAYNDFLNSKRVPPPAPAE